MLIADTDTESFILDRFYSKYFFGVSFNSTFFGELSASAGDWSKFWD